MTTAKEALERTAKCQDVGSAAELLRSSGLERPAKRLVELDKALRQEDQIPISLRLLRLTVAALLADPGLAPASIGVSPGTGDLLLCWFMPSSVTGRTGVMAARFESNGEVYVTMSGNSDLPESAGNPRGRSGLQEALERLGRAAEHQADPRGE